jgi:hypothetical protein
MYVLDARPQLCHADLLLLSTRKGKYLYDPSGNRFYIKVRPLTPVF